MTYHFSIPDMSCGHCVKAVTSAIAEVDPKAETAVDLTTKTATVESALPAEALGKAIETAGYAATLSD
ncbi:hypothetical protein BJF92_10190 [Rhizobium rhizosphaerae]|uniref:HMA domain-containing protein n=1 Tax=Xaviernesmea rhizosphaerae TaxID=1672749 RepID=A0A1Q9AM62_9HYPH|nr:heavy-metal-associated domain-containing protein [Xaviernesmea rhizosphaerae]OLP56478.1 hypothetical protein BJF92_10190 [Xaviernesmea rhizosphaerae]OQP87780.1 hypothetical protein BTR14_04285 [Xaviernesmea rhizosphaerae]